MPLSPSKKKKIVKGWAVAWVDDGKLSGGWGGGSFAVFPFKWQANFAKKHYVLSKIIKVTIHYEI